MPSIEYFTDQRSATEDRYGAINKVTNEVLIRDTKAALSLAIAAYWIEYSDSE